MIALADVRGLEAASFTCLLTLAIALATCAISSA